MKTPKRLNVSRSSNVLEDDDAVTAAAPRNSRGSSKRRAVAPAKNNSRSAKPANKGKTTQRSAPQRDTNNSRDKGKRTSKRDFSEMEIEFELDRETKNKIMYVELDESGNKVEAFRGGRIGQIYLLKDDCGRNPPERIRVIIQEA